MTLNVQIATEEKNICEIGAILANVDFNRFREFDIVMCLEKENKFYITLLIKLMITVRHVTLNIT